MTCIRCTTPSKCDAWGCAPGTFPSERNDPRPYKLRSIVPIEGLDQTLDPYQYWPQRPVTNDPNDVILWPCGTWCYREELHAFTHKSDDYEQIPADSERALRVTGERSEFIPLARPRER